MGNRTVRLVFVALAAIGVERFELVKLCKAEYAKSILTTDRHVSTIMPCTFSVWEGDEGKVYLSKMNLALMAKMVGSNMAKVMGQKVVCDEEQILRDLLEYLSPTIRKGTSF